MAGSGPLCILVALPGEGRALQLPGSTNIRLVQTGIGAARAAAAARQALVDGASGLVSTGYAGGLDPALPIGQVLLPTRILRASMAQAFDVDPTLHGALVAELGGATVRGNLVESRDVVASPGDKAALRRRCDALAVDMESAAIAAVASDAGLPFICARVVLDDATTALPPEVTGFTSASGRLRPLAVAGALLRSPSLLGPLRELDRARTTADASLARVGAALNALAA